MSSVANSSGTISYCSRALPPYPIRENVAMMKKVATAAPFLTGKLSAA
jgi:hypothetical protein